MLRRRKPQHGDAPVEIAGLRLDPARAPRDRQRRSRSRFGPTEFRLLHYLMTHPNRVYSRTAAAGRGLGRPCDSSRSARWTCTSAGCAQALTPSGHDALIETVRGSGYALRAESSCGRGHEPG